MNGQRQGMFVPALIGGLLSGILTAIPVVGCLCCVWIIAGGIVAAYFLSKDFPVVLTTGDGAIVGIFAGIIGAVVDSIVSIPFDAMMRNSEWMNKIMELVSEYAQDLPSGWENWFETGPFGGAFSIAWFFLGLAISVVLFSAFSALGGIIGISLFKKKPDVNTQGNIDASQDSSHR